MTSLFGSFLRCTGPTFLPFGTGNTERTIQSPDYERPYIHLSNTVNPPIIEYMNKNLVKIACCMIRSIVNLPMDYYLYCIQEMIRYDHV